MCYTLRALNPDIYSENKHLKHPIKIHEVNKGLEFMSLLSIFKEKSAISYIVSCFC